MAVLWDPCIDLDEVNDIESAFQHPQQQSPKSCPQDSSACRLGATASLRRAIHPTIGPLSGLIAAQLYPDVQHRSVPRYHIKVAEAQPQGISEQKEEVRKQERSLRARNRSERKPKVQKTAPNCKLSMSKQKLMTESKEGNDQIIFDCSAYICQRSLTRVLWIFSTYRLGEWWCLKACNMPCMASTQADAWKCTCLRCLYLCIFRSQSKTDAS